MRSRRSGGFILPAFVVVTLAFTGESGSQSISPAVTASPSEEDISRALAALKADPNLTTERTITTLQWKSSGKKTQSARPAWLAWITGLFVWIEQSARLLIWAAAAVLAGMLAVYVYRLVRGRRLSDGMAESSTAPTHVRDLDIRPETLPDDVGAASRALWDRGEERAALALLYRGMLSRLAHVHRLPIRDSTTEGDCLALTVQHLSDDKHRYTSLLIRVWQRSVYGREAVQTATVYSLCDEFSAVLDAWIASDHLSEGAA